MQAPGTARDVSSLASYALGLACVAGYVSGTDVSADRWAIPAFGVLTRHALRNRYSLVGQSAQGFSACGHCCSAASGYWCMAANPPYWVPTAAVRSGSWVQKAGRYPGYGTFMLCVMAAARSVSPDYSARLLYVRIQGPVSTSRRRCALTHLGSNPQGAIPIESCRV